jgi:cytochrome c oxidase subunit 4
MTAPTTGTFVRVWVGLMLLAAGSFLVSFLSLGTWSAVIAIGIGAAKAILIATFFMHLSQQPPISRWSFGVGIALAMLLLIMVGLDVTTRSTPAIEQPGLETSAPRAVPQR